MAANLEYLHLVLEMNGSCSSSSSWTFPSSKKKMVEEGEKLQLPWLRRECPENFGV